ncbi:MAG: ATPase [Sphaerobacteraceae bacterium]|nr:MAG: ATPase [Sphaerobacteraceae bacterium]
METQQRNSAAPTTDILELIDRLEDLVAQGSRVPWGGKIMVDEDEVLALVDQLRMSMPQEIKQARRVVQDRQKIITDAQTEADKILSVAKERAEYLMNEQGLVNEAKARSEDILRQSREHSRKSMQEVDQYAHQMLTQLERVLEENLHQIQQAKGVMER